MIIEVLRGWLRRVRETPESSLPSGPVALIDRRVWALGYAPAEGAIIERARRVEMELRDIRRALVPVEFKDCAASQMACRCRTRIAEYMNYGDGRLARAVNHWPALDSGELDQALDEGEQLISAAREALYMLGQIEASSERLRRIAARYREKTPGLWRAHAGGDAFEDQLRRAHSSERLREIHACITEAEQSFPVYLGRLEKTRRALRAVLGEGGDGAESSADIEEQIVNLVDRLDRASREVRSPALRAVDETSERHLVHLGVHDPRGGVQATALGSVRRNLARKRQLESAPMRER